MLKYDVIIVMLCNVCKCYTNIKGFVDCVPDLIKKNRNSSDGMYQLLQMKWIWRETGPMIKIFRLIHEQRTIHLVFFGPLNRMFAPLYGYWQSQNRGITYAQHVLRNELYGQINFDYSIPTNSLNNITATFGTNKFGLRASNTMLECLLMPTSEEYINLKSLARIVKLKNYTEGFVPNCNEESSLFQKAWKVSRQPPPNQKPKAFFETCVCFDLTSSLLVGGSSLAVFLSFCLICLLAIKICLRSRDNNKTSIIIPNRQGDYSSVFKENKFFSSKDIIIIAKLFL